MTAPAFLTMEHVTHRYGKRTVLADVNLSLVRGEVFGLLGPNGAGKSTLLSLIATLIRPAEGDIRIGETSILASPNAIRSRMGYVPQEIALHTVLSARSNLAFWAGVYGLSGAVRDEAVRRALADVQLAERADERLDAWSGGMRRRLNIAAAIMHGPELLVMDEPTAGVDAASRRTIAGMLARFRSEGRTVLIASHDTDELESVCDRIGVLRAGRFLAVGTVADVLDGTGRTSLESLLLGLEERE